MHILAKLIADTAGRDRNLIRYEPPTGLLLEIIYGQEVVKMVAKVELRNLEPLMVNGRFITRGWMRSVITRLLGVKELPIVATNLYLD